MSAMLKNSLVASLALAALLLPGSGAHGESLSEPLRARTETSITKGTALITEVTVSRNGRIDGTYELRRWAWLTGKCGFSVVRLRDAKDNVLYSSEVFRGCANPRSERGGAFHRRITAEVAQRVERVEIINRHYSSNNALRRGEEWLGGGHH